MNKLIQHFGSQQKLANAFNKKFGTKIRTGHIYYWLKKGIPVNRAKQIEILTSGQFSRSYLRPDIFN